jgi:hypothetical protein
VVDGHKVKVLPPGYAQAAYPQKNVSVQSCEANSIEGKGARSSSLGARQAFSMASSAKWRSGLDGDCPVRHTQR